MADQREVALVHLLRVQTEEHDRRERDDEAEQHDVVRNWKRGLDVAEIAELVVEAQQADRPDDADHAENVRGHEERSGHDDELLDDLRMVRWRPVADPSLVVKPGQVVRLRIIVAEQVVLAFDHLF